MFSISNLRKPYHMLDNVTRKQLSVTLTKHKKIDENFLENRIKPRMVIIMADGTDLNSHKNKDKHQVPIFRKRGPNNVAININKYIAKYDFDIARKLNPNTEDKKGENEIVHNEDEVRHTFNTNAILEIL